MTQTFKYRDATADFARRIGSTQDPGSVELAALRARLILEEAAETLAALAARDVVEAADGLADLRYVVYGAAAAYGVDVPDPAPTKPLYGPVALEPADALRFCQTVVPRVSNAAQTLAGCPYSSAARTTMCAGRALWELDEACASFALSAGLPLDALFWEVHRSNMTKAPGGAGSGKYGPGGKGPGYQAPDVVGVLEAARLQFNEPETPSQRP